jgi:small subunit ribosomal protein S18
MARNNDRDRGKRVVKDTRPRTKKKVCIFCKERADWVDYKDVNLLRRFMSDRGKIRARRVTGNCAQHQRDVAVAIKTARELAMLPYTQRTATERAPRPDRRAEGGRPGPRAAVEPEVEELEEAEEVGVGIGGED